MSNTCIAYQGAYLKQAQRISKGSKQKNFVLPCRRKQILHEPPIQEKVYLQYDRYETDEGAHQSRGVEVGEVIVPLEAKNSRVCVQIHVKTL